MSAVNVITQIRRDAGRHDFIPAYSTAQLLQGVCHLAHVPEKDLERSSIAKKMMDERGPAESAQEYQTRIMREARQAKSRRRFDAHKEEIYTLLAQGRGVKHVADHFHIGYEALRRYLEESK
jgi:hypothetical protein